MRVVITIATLALLATTSCKKEQIQSVNTPSTIEDINVEYKITNQSSDVIIEYLAPVQGSQGLQTIIDTINKTYKSYNFTAKANQFLSVKSWNHNPSWNNVTVDIYINGELFKTGANSNTNSVAKAEGIFEE